MKSAHRALFFLFLFLFIRYTSYLLVFDIASSTIDGMNKYHLLEQILRRSISTRYMEQWQSAQNSLVSTSALIPQIQSTNNQFLLYGPIVSEQEAFLIEAVTGEQAITARMIRIALDDMNGDVSVRINSPGGDFFEAVAIYTAFAEYHNRRKGKVSMFVDGLAASAASVIALAGSEIVINRLATMMIHLSWMTISGNKDELIKGVRILSSIDQQLTEILSEKMKKTKEEVMRLLARETYYVGQEIIDAGLADRMVEVERLNDRRDTTNNKVDQPVQQLAKQAAQSLEQPVNKPVSMRPGLIACVNAVKSIS